MSTLLRGFAFGMACMAAVTGSNASAADYPSRNIRFIVGYPPGGSTDIVARLMGQWLSEHMHQQFIIENKPGAGNNIATEAAINAPPDGYTVFLVNPANAVNASLYQHLSLTVSGMTAWLVRSPLGPRSSSRAMVARRWQASSSAGVKAISEPQAIVGPAASLPIGRGQAGSWPYAKNSTALRNSRSPSPSAARPCARPARMLRRQDVAFGMRHQAEHAAASRRTGRPRRPASRWG